MPRRPRDLESSTWFHVTNRGYDRRDIFNTDGDRLLLEELMAEAFGSHLVTLHAYALMTNHFHLLVECPDGDVSAALQRLTGRYAAAFNERHRRTGPLFTGRFWSGPIMSEEQRAIAGLYVHRNPLAFVPELALSAYRWSSLGCYTGRRDRPNWLTTDVLLPDGDGRAYLSDVLKGPEEGGHNLESIVVTVARCSGVDPEDVLRGGRGALNPSRAVAIVLAIDLEAASAAEIAARFGVADTRGVHQILRRVRERLAGDPELAELREVAMTQLKLSPSGSVPDGLNQLRSA